MPLPYWLLPVPSLPTVIQSTPATVGFTICLPSLEVHRTAGLRFLRAYQSPANSCEGQTKRTLV